MATRVVKYVGPQEGVDIPALGVVVERGAEVEVDAELAKELLAREEWEAVASPRKGAKA